MYLNEATLNNIVVVDATNDEDLYLANFSANNMLFSPGSSGDEMLVQLLHSKIRKIVGDSLIVGQIRVSSDESPLSYCYDTLSDVYDDLPLLATDYFKLGKVKDNDPWWLRPDGFTSEFSIDDDIDISTVEFPEDPLVDFNKYVAEVTGKKSTEPAKILQVEKWKPKKV